MRKSRHGFTLVELLVVIGIIALLVSILLPSLNKARAAANLLLCQSNLRSVGQTLLMYAGQNKGLAPWGDVFGKVETFQGSGAIADLDNRYSGPIGNRWYWPDTVSMLLGEKPLTDPTSQGYNPANSNCFQKASKWSKFLQDVDVPQTGNASAYNCQYCANWRALVVSRRDPATAAPNYKCFRQPQIGGKNSSEWAIMWDTAVYLTGGYAGQGGNSICWALDSYTIYNEGGGNNLLKGQNRGKTMGQRVMLGAVSLAAVLDPNNPTIKELKAENYDNDHCYDGPDMRFRHVNNTKANLLFADGHVEPRVIGDVYERDVCKSR